MRPLVLILIGALLVALGAEAEEPGEVTTVRGALVDAFTGKPLSRQELTAVDSDGNRLRTAKTDRKGRFQLPALPRKKLALVLGIGSDPIVVAGQRDPGGVDLREAGPTLDAGTFRIVRWYKLGDELGPICAERRRFQLPEGVDGVALKTYVTGRGDWFFQKEMLAPNAARWPLPWRGVICIVEESKVLGRYIDRSSLESVLERKSGMNATWRHWSVTVLREDTGEHYSHELEYTPPETLERLPGDPDPATMSDLTDDLWAWLATLDDR